MEDQMTPAEPHSLERNLELAWKPSEVVIRLGIGLAIAALLVAFWAGVIMLAASLLT